LCCCSKKYILNTNTTHTAEGSVNACDKKQMMNK
jgi:hypothetical protein